MIDESTKYSFSVFQEKSNEFNFSLEASLFAVNKLFFHPKGLGLFKNLTFKQPSRFFRIEKMFQNGPAAQNHHFFTYLRSELFCILCFSFEFFVYFLFVMFTIKHVNI